MRSTRLNLTGLALPLVAFAFASAASALPPSSTSGGAASSPEPAVTTPIEAPTPDAPPPPAPPEQIAEAREIGRRLLDAVRRGSLQLVHVERDTRQLQQIAEYGYCLRPEGGELVFAPALLRTFDHLVEVSTPRKPLVLLSFYRPSTLPRPRGPHTYGFAIDIAAFGGYAIHSSDRVECVDGVLAVLAALEPRSYRLGLPKPPGTDIRGLLPPPSRPATWPFFPAPVPVTTEIMGHEVVVPRQRGGHFTRDLRGYLKGEATAWENERQASFSDIGSDRVKEAIAAAYRRGVDIHALFPDALDHLHLDVRPRTAGSLPPPRWNPEPDVLEDEYAEPDPFVVTGMPRTGIASALLPAGGIACHDTG